jgi:hypothetical protein
VFTSEACDQPQKLSVPDVAEPADDEPDEPDPVHPAKTIGAAAVTASATADLLALAR